MVWGQLVLVIWPVNISGGFLLAGVPDSHHHRRTSRTQPCLASIKKSTDIVWCWRLNGAALLFLSLWSVRNDLAWRNLRHKLPLTRYIAWCLALGLTWLGVGGGLNLIFGGQVAGPRYDAALHVVFIGFVISMIFGHAPIIFPAILGVPINFQPAFYIQLILLHVSLALRVIADYANLYILRMWGGLLNEVAILLFIIFTVLSIRKSLVGK